MYLTNNKRLRFLTRIAPSLIDMGLVFFCGGKIFPIDPLITSICAPITIFFAIDLVHIFRSRGHMSSHLESMSLWAGIPSRIMDHWDSSISDQKYKLKNLLKEEARASISELRMSLTHSQKITTNPSGYMSEETVTSVDERKEIKKMISAVHEATKIKIRDIENLSKTSRGRYILYALYVQERNRIRQEKASQEKQKRSEKKLAEILGNRRNIETEKLVNDLVARYGHNSK